MFIWIIYNLPLRLHYTKSFVIPGGFVTGPNKPQEIDSYLFPSLQHLAALQHKGLWFFDAFTSMEIQQSILIIIIALADSPGAASMSGFVRHSGKQGCQLFCMIIRQKSRRGWTLFPSNVQTQFL